MSNAVDHISVGGVVVQSGSKATAFRLWTPETVEKYNKDKARKGKDSAARLRSAKKHARVLDTMLKAKGFKLIKAERVKGSGDLGSKLAYSLPTKLKNLVVEIFLTGDEYLNSAITIRKDVGAIDTPTKTVEMLIDWYVKYDALAASFHKKNARPKLKSPKVTKKPLVDIYR